MFDTRCGYVLIILPFYFYAEWYQAFYKLAFDIIIYLYELMLDSETVQSRNNAVHHTIWALFYGLSSYWTPKHGKINMPYYLRHFTNYRSLSGIINI